MSKVWLDKDFLRVRTRQRTVQDCTVLYRQIKIHSSENLKEEKIKRDMSSIEA